MGSKILALLENSVGPKLLLETRLTALGYAVSVLSSPERLRMWGGGETFDWLILDEAACGADEGRLLRYAAGRWAPARIVWLGRPPSGVRAAIAATFAKPLDYDEIVRFLSARASQGPACSTDRSRESQTGCCSRRGLNSPRRRPGGGKILGRGGRTGRRRTGGGDKG